MDGCTHRFGGRALAPCRALHPAAGPSRTRSVKQLAQREGFASLNGAIRPYAVRPRCVRADAAAAAEAVQVSAAEGTPTPLGPSPTDNGVNFAVYSAHATKMTLCLFDADNQPITELDMKKSGEVFHVEAVNCAKSGVLYGVRVAGEGGWEDGHRWTPEKVLLDPYAPLLSGRRHWATRDEFEQYERGVGSVFRGTYDFDSAPFDWEGVTSPGYSLKDLIIYEVPLRTFTASETSGLPAEQRGTYKGFAAKVDHLKKLGVNAVEILPLMEYDELEFQRDKNPRDHMVNIWGYSHIQFMAPMTRFGTGGAGPQNAANELKDMVKTLHKNGIEVILDVVFNHTAEGSDVNPYILCHRGIDCLSYYQMNLNQYEQLLNYSGCGNTTSCNQHAMLEQVVDACKHWVTEYHVDGFRFDLATALCRDATGRILNAPPLIRKMSKDPILSKVKLIAEPWDCGGYHVGSFPNWDIWAEWNGIYRDVVRRFIKGDAGMKKDFATRISGSADLYHVNNRRPYHSINFVVAHDGFTLHDLVAYNGKHNEANGENGRDGTNDNFSWNCGKEGETGDGGVRALRWRQMRNFHLALMISQGTPMVLGGDEYAQTRNGNNNWYGHDNQMTHFNWAPNEEQEAFFRYYSSLIKFRRECPLLGRDAFLSPKDITWHEDNWDNDESKFIAFTLHDSHGDYPDLYCAFNAHHVNLNIKLPPAPHGKKWCRIIDTNLPSPRDFVEGGNKGVEQDYCVTAWSSILLIAKPR